MQEIDLLEPTRIIRTNRRTIAIEITNKGELIVRSPRIISIDKIYRFIVDKSQWIIQKRTLALNKNTKNTLNLDDGDVIKVLGKNYIIKSSNSSRVSQDDEFLYLPTNRVEALKSYLKKVLKPYIMSRVKYYADLGGYNYKSIAISSAKSNWGSCGYRNSLHFTFRLALCPSEVIDYIVVHELVHTSIKNHSKNFYAKVEELYPNYKEANKFLKDNRYIMDLL